LIKEFANNGTNAKPSSINRKKDKTQKKRDRKTNNFDNLCG
jgi:hypothetical protein